MRRSSSLRPEIVPYSTRAKKVSTLVSLSPVRKIPHFLTTESRVLGGCQLLRGGCEPRQSVCKAGLVQTGPLIRLGWIHCSVVQSCLLSGSETLSIISRTHGLPRVPRPCAFRSQFTPRRNREAMIMDWRTYWVFYDHRVNRAQFQDLSHLNVIRSRILRWKRALTLEGRKPISVISYKIIFGRLGQ